jgi:hypothetical protein
MNRNAVLTFLLLLSSIAIMSQCSNNSIIEIRADHTGKRVDVYVDDELFTSYIYPDQIKKPVLWPVISMGGNTITRSFPLKNKQGDRVDHPHHVGIWFNYGDVNGLDFWNNSEARPLEDRMLYGSIRHKEVLNTESKGNEAILETRSEWLSPDEEILLSEKTSFRFLVEDGLRIIDRRSTLEAMVDTVLFKDNKEGMFAIRVARELELPSEGKMKLMDAHGDITEVEASNNSVSSGNYRSATGMEGSDVWGTRSPWMKLSGIINGEMVSIIIIDHPSNPGYPTYWHARGYGLFAANSLGQSVFSKGENCLNFSMVKGQDVDFNYRLVVASEDLSNEQINQLANAFATIK